MEGDCVYSRVIFLSLLDVYTCGAAEKFSSVGLQWESVYIFFELDLVYLQLRHT